MMYILYMYFCEVKFDLYKGGKIIFIMCDGYILYVPATVFLRDSDSVLIHKLCGPIEVLLTLGLHVILMQYAALCGLHVWCVCVCVSVHMCVG